MTNRTLLKIIKVHLEGAKGVWLEELPNVLWAYRTTAKTLTGETPFKLNYGAEAVVPIKVGITSMKREFFLGVNIDYQLKVNLDCLDKTREEASKRMNKYQQKMTEYYNKRVKLRRLNVGDFVLRRITLATKDLAKARINLGRILQDHPLVKTRKLSPGIDGWEEIANHGTLNI